MPPLFSGNGRHRRPRQAPSFVVTAGVTGAGIALPLLGATGANAADASTWDKVAECESGGLWSADQGNGFYGGLQLDQETWEEHGGKEFADRPDLASRGQQIEIAEKILRDAGTGEWSECAEGAGLSADADETPEESDDSDQPVPERPYPTDPSGETPEDDGASGSPEDGSGDSGDSGGSGDSEDSGDSADSGGDSDGSGPSEGSGDSGTPAPAPSSPAGEQDGSGGSSGSGSSEGSDSSGDSGDADGSGGPSYPGDPSEGGGDPSGDPSGTPGGSDESADGRDDSDDSADGRGSDDSADGRDDSDDSADGRGGDGEHPSREGDEARPGTGSGEHRVSGGESLSLIAEEYEVSGGWPKLYEQNRDVVGSDPDLILPGQELRLR